MKKILLSMLIVALCAGCASKKVAEYGFERVKVEIPCKQEGFDDANYFRATGTASALNQQSARRAALENAKSMVHEKLGGFVSGLTSDYNGNLRTNAKASDVEGVFESEFETLIEKNLNDALQTCEEMFVSKDGLYESWIAIAIPKKQIIDDIMKQIEESGKDVKINREEFRKFAEKRAAEMKTGNMQVAQ
jgi:hypothetical protein